MTIALAVLSMIAGILLGYSWGVADENRKWKKAWFEREDDFKQWQSNIEKWVGQVQAMLLSHGYTLDIKK